MSEDRLEHVRMTLAQIANEKIVEKFVKVLNEAHNADPVAIQTLFLNRVPCNDKLASHETIPVNEEHVRKNETARIEVYTSINFLGLINGALFAATGKRIVAITSVPDGYGRAGLLGFEVR